MDRLVERGLSCVSVLDVSGAALTRAKARLGAAGSRVRWIEADVTSGWRRSPVDIWHDRAVFHFLTEAADRRQYLDRARESIKPGGHMLLATFAADGPIKCSGLPVMRYGVEELAAEVGRSFELRQTADELHTTPSGGVQHFTYAVFRLVDVGHLKR